MNAKVMYVGMDVHKENVVFSVYLDHDPKCCETKTTSSSWSSIYGYFQRLRGRYEPTAIVSCYEAGPCGYGLARRLISNGIECLVAAPGRIPQRATNRVKTDRRDAEHLARMLRAGELEAIYVPDKQDEAVREIVRLRDSYVKMRKSIAQQLKSMFLRHDKHYLGNANWSQKHQKWISNVDFGIEHLNYARDSLLDEYKQLSLKIKSCESTMDKCAKHDRYRESIQKLCLLRGIGPITALAMCVEIVDFRRFHSAGKFMAFLGLVPSEYSSGNSVRKGGITKTGNSLVRRLLIQGSKQFSFAYSKKRLPEKNEDETDNLFEQRTYAYKAIQRLQKKRRYLEARGKNTNVISVAIARELSGFVWGMMTNNVA